MASFEECFVYVKFMRNEAVMALGLLGNDGRNFQLCFPDTRKASFSSHISALRMPSALHLWPYVPLPWTVRAQIGHGVCLHPDVLKVSIRPRGWLSSGPLPTLFGVPFQTLSYVDSTTQSSLVDDLEVQPRDTQRQCSFRHVLRTWGSLPKTLLRSR